MYHLLSLRDDSITVQTNIVVMTLLHFECFNLCKAHDCGLGTEAVYTGVYVGMCVHFMCMSIDVHALVVQAIA